MKRIIICILALVMCLVPLSACSQNYVTGKNEVDIFSCFDMFGGSLKKLDFTSKGGVRIEVEFASSKQAETAEKYINTDIAGLTEENFKNGDRVISLVKQKDRQAEFFVHDITALKSSKLMIMTNGEYIKKYYNNEAFIGRLQETVLPTELDANKLVLVMDGVPQIDVVTAGSVIAVSKDGNIKFDGNTIISANSSCVVIFSPSNTILIAVSVTAAVIIILAVFLLLIKFRVFTNIKLKNAKKHEK